MQDAHLELMPLFSQLNNHSDIKVNPVPVQALYSVIKSTVLYLSHLLLASLL